MSLQKIMAEIKKIKPFADEEVLESPRETLGGRLARQRKAKEDLKNLAESYRKELFRTAVFVLVTGSGREDFITKANEVLGFFKADADKFYTDIASKISPSLYEGKDSSPGLLDVVSRVLENKALDIGIIGYPMVAFRQEHRRLLKSRTDFIGLIKEVINKQVGLEVVGIQAIKDISMDALNAGHEGKTTPILISLESVSSDLTAALTSLSGKVGVVNADQEVVSVASIATALNDIKNQLKTTNVASVSLMAEAEEATITAETIQQATEQMADRGLADTQSGSLVLDPAMVEYVSNLDKQEDPFMVPDEPAKKKRTRKPKPTENT